MPDDGIHDYGPVISKRILGSGGLVLVVGDGPVEAIDEALRARELAVVMFEDLEALLEDASVQSPATVLLWALITLLRGLTASGVI